MNPQVLSEESRASVQNYSWKTSREKVGKLGSAIVSIPDASEASTSAPTAPTSVNPITCFHRHIHWWIHQIMETLKAPFALRQSKQAQSMYVTTIHSLKPTNFYADQADLQNDLLSALATNKDLYLTSTPLEQRRCTREAIALHAFNHVTKYVTKCYDESTLFLTSYYLENVGVCSKTTSGFLAQQKLILMHYLKMFRTKASPDPQYSSSYPFVPLHSTGFEPSHHILHLQIFRSKTNLDFCRNTVYPLALSTNWWPQNQGHMHQTTWTRLKETWTIISE